MRISDWSSDACSSDLIWEIRGQKQHFTHSKVMAWVAFDRIATVAESMENGREFSDNCRRAANEIHEEVCREAYDPELGSFVQYYGCKCLDASQIGRAHV